jgi:hypothetical protein
MQDSNFMVGEGATTDRRNLSRRQSDYEVVVWLSPQQSVVGFMLDQSSGGGGVMVEATDTPELGFQVCIEHQGTKRLATIQSVREFEARRQVRLGLSWED